MALAGELGVPPLHTLALTLSDANFTTVETVTDTITASLINGKKYTVKFLGAWKTSVAGDKITCRIREDSLTGTEQYNTTMYITTTAMQVVVPMEIEYTAVSTAAKTFVVTGVRFSGTGTESRSGAATLPGKFTIDQVI